MSATKHENRKASQVANSCRLVYDVLRQYFFVFMFLGARDVSMEFRNRNNKEMCSYGLSAPNRMMDCWRQQQTPVGV